MRSITANRLLDVNEGPALSRAQIAVDTAIGDIQEMASDWRTVALSLAAPLAVSRLSGVFREINLVRSGIVAESSLARVAVGNSARFASLGRASMAAMGLGTFLSACGLDTSGSGTAAGPAPRSLTATAPQFSVTDAPSAGTTQGFQTSLNSMGQLSVLWTDLDASNPNPSAVLLRNIPSDGSASSIVEVNRPAGAVAVFPSISSNDHGSVLVSWTNTAGPDAPSGIMARRFNGSQAQGNVFQIVPSEMRSVAIQGSQALQADGSFTVVSNENSSSCGVCARNYGANNIQTGVTTLSDPGSSVLSSSLASNSEGHWAWAGILQGENNEKLVRFRYFRPTQGLSGSTTFSIGNPQTAVNARLAILTNNNSLLVWESNQGLRGMVVSPDGTPVSAQLSLNALPPGGNFSVTSDQVGAFVVSWIDQGQVRASLLSARGQVVASNISISDANNASDLSIAGNEEGRISFVWRRSLPGHYDLVARNFRINY